MKRIFFCLTLFFLLSFALAQVSSSTQTSFFVESDVTDDNSVELDSLDSSFDFSEVIVLVILGLIIIAVIYYFVFKKQSNGGKKKTVKRRKKK